ncbi:MAG: glycosyl hydrolase, repeat-containing protein [Solirubrobacterales bacterium]|nr:glycosyl hydrolase, repeat-containing protein [Solirubrobacterales bacterium]
MSTVSARAAAALLAATLPFAAASAALGAVTAPEPGLAFAPPFTIQAPTSFGLGYSNGTEPRLAVDGANVYAITSPSPDDAHAVVWRSADGGATFRPTTAEIPGQMAPSTDVDIVRTATHRLVAVEQDAQISQMHVTGYSDDGGTTWKRSAGTMLADQDRPWLGVGPDDPHTHLPIVYLAWHNLFTGILGPHDMFVQTSRDGGASFGPPVAVTKPGDPAWLDLQCGASTGPSSLSVNPRTGRLYLVFGVVGSRLGGCGALLTPTPAEVFVPANKIWVATSPDGTAGSWRLSVAVDDSAHANMVGMQLSPAALDSAGNVYVVYPESPRLYPDYSGARVLVRWAPPDLSHWSAPITIAAGGGPGNILTQIEAGDPGRIDVTYLHGDPRPGSSPAWRLAVAQSLDATASVPRVRTVQASQIPAYTGTASQLEAACETSPGAGIVNAAFCPRASDVWGTALTPECRLLVAWAGVANDAPGSHQATYISRQVAGPTLCRSAADGKRPVTTPPDCLRSHTLTIEIPRPRPGRLVRARAYVHGHRIRVHVGRRISARVHVTGRAAEWVTVKFDLTILRHGRLRIVRETRRYRTCRPRRAR